MIIGIVPDPLNHPDWPKMAAFLEPAAKLGDLPVWLESWVMWAAFDGLALRGVAVTRLTNDGFGEAIMVAGRDVRRWLPEMDRLCGNWMKAEGMKTFRTNGRKGWRRILKDWNVIGEDDGLTCFERVL